jgi:hypothetical protein
MREREREGGHIGEAGAPGAFRAGLDRAGLGCEPGQKPTTHATIDRKPPANQNLKRDETR